MQDNIVRNSKATNASKHIYRGPNPNSRPVASKAACDLKPAMQSHVAGDKSLFLLAVGLSPVASAEMEKPCFCEGSVGVDSTSYIYPP